MRLIPHGVPPLDSRLHTKLFKFIRHELSTFVILQGLDLETSSKLNVRLECLECIQSLRLGFEKVQTPEACCNINKDAKVPVAFRRLSGHGSMEISMNEFQRNSVRSCCPVHISPLIYSKA